MVSDGNTLSLLLQQLLEIVRIRKAFSIAKGKKLGPSIEDGRNIYLIFPSGLRISEYQDGTEKHTLKSVCFVVFFFLVLFHGSNCGLVCVMV